MWPFGTGLFHQGQISRGSSRLCVYQYYFPFYHWMYHSCSISNLFKSVWGCFSLGLLPIQLLWTPEYRLSESVQFSSVAQLCPTLGNAMNRSTPGLPVHHQLPEFTLEYIPPSSVFLNAGSIQESSKKLTNTLWRLDLMPRHPDFICLG